MKTLGWLTVGVSVILLSGLTDAAPFRCYLGSLALMILGVLLGSTRTKKVKRDA